MDTCCGPVLGRGVHLGPWVLCRTAKCGCRSISSHSCKPERLHRAARPLPGWHATLTGSVHILYGSSPVLIAFAFIHVPHRWLLLLLLAALVLLWLCCCCRTT